MRPTIFMVVTRFFLIFPAIFGKNRDFFKGKKSPFFVENFSWAEKNHDVGEKL